MKGKVTLNEISFSLSLDIVGNIWDKASSQLNKTSSMPFTWLNNTSNKSQFCDIKKNVLCNKTVCAPVLSMQLTSITITLSNPFSM